MRAKDFIKENDVEERPKTNVEGEPAGVAYFDAIMEKVYSGEIVPLDVTDMDWEEFSKHV